jgi:hypothetical protein
MRRLLMTFLGAIAAVLMTMMVGVILPSTAAAQCLASGTQVTGAWDGRKT